MNYQQTLDYLYARLPMFQRIGPAAYKNNLNNTYALANHLNNPERKFKSIHIAGTNGKGSVAHMLASIFQEAGYKTGLCTSPHLKDFRERVRINGRMMPESFLVDFINQHLAFFNQIKPSFFEMSIALCFEYFAHEKPDIAIIETGLGGRLDSTNIIHPELSVITNIGMDHTNLLGDTLEKIAFEKAGIIKENTPVVVGKTREKAKKVFTESASKKNASLFFAEEHYQIESYKQLWDEKKKAHLLNIVLNDKENSNRLEVKSDLPGLYQADNIVTVLKAIDVIRKQGKYSISQKAIIKGLGNVISNTNIAGRWQTLSNHPRIICDTGHNADGITKIVENLKMMNASHIHFVLGMVNDKDTDEILKILPPENATYYFCTPAVPRGLDSGILAEKAKNTGLKGYKVGEAGKALLMAKGEVKSNELIFIGGSTFLVAEILQMESDSRS
ncbi:MAG: bifunctional folylpolyglutamate synthase/dihydrofolate synthase [Bacteroidota bacterium]